MLKENDVLDMYILVDLIDRYDGESPENVSQRYDNFKQCWKQVKTNIQVNHFVLFLK